MKLRDDQMDRIRVEAKDYAKKIQPVFELMDWRWARSEGRVVPSADMIEDVLVMLALDTIKFRGLVRTGRLFANLEDGALEFGIQDGEDILLHDED